MLMLIALLLGHKAAGMCTGQGLHNLFVTILLFCNPVHPHQLWEATCKHLCNDLEHHIQHPFPIIPEPEENQVYDYGLHLIDFAFHKSGKSLRDFPEIPLPQENWVAVEGNQLLAEQLAYDVQTLQGIVEHGITTLNHEQRMVYDEALNAVQQAVGHRECFFVHSAEGCGKTYLFNLIAAAVRAQGKVILCIASSGIASLLLSGERIAHSHFKIPIPVHEASTCNIKKNNQLHQLLNQTALIVWDEIPMQYCYAIESVDHTLQDLLEYDVPFGGIVVLLGEDFHQTLPVISHGFRKQIVGATLCRSHLWPQIQLHHLHTNMHLD